MKTPFVYRRRVEFADTDLAGIAHFSSLMRFMEEAEHDFLRSLGLSVISEKEGMHITFPRVHVTCSFQSPAKFEDIIDIAVSVGKVSEKSVTYQFELSISGRPVATGSFVAACCRVEFDGPDKRIFSTPIPTAIRHLLEGNA